ncbi:hypothetical protein Tco_1191304 [Tanacetum coccineum]
MLDDKAHEWLVEWNPNSWYGCSTTFKNEILESFNSRIVRARGKPIITMLEDIRVYIMQRIFCMNKLAFDNKDSITPSVRRQMEYNKRIQREIEVRRGDQSFGVNLHQMKYVCKLVVKWIPYVYAMTGYMHMKINPYMGVDEWYSQWWFEPSRGSKGGAKVGASKRGRGSSKRGRGSNTIPFQGLRDEASDEEHQFKMDMEAVFEMKREQMVIDEDDQFWEECAREFNHVEEHRAQDKGMPEDVADGKQPMTEDVAAGKQPMIEDDPLQGGADLPTQESTVEANPNIPDPSNPRQLKFQIR